MKYFKFLLFCFILFLIPNVFAQDFNVDNTNITSPNSGGTGKYTGLEIYNTGTTAVYNIGTRYNGQLSRIIFNLSSGGYAPSDGFEQGHTYTLTMNMATDDWRNKFGSVSVKCEGSSGQELSNGHVTYINYRKIKFSFTAPSNSWCQFVYVDLKSTNIVSTAFTGVSNWNLSSMVISDPSYDSSSGSGSGSGSTSSNQDIINNANQNTQDIINNQSENSNNIIDNANQNTQDIIDNQNKNTESTNKLLGSCHKNLFNFNAYSNGNEYIIKDNSINGFKIRSDRYAVDSDITLHDFCPSCQSGKTYYLGGISTSSNSKYIYLSSIWNYNSSRTLTDNDLSSSVLFYGIYPGGSGSISDYVNVSNIYIVEGSSSSVYGPYNEQICTSKLDDTNQAINDSSTNIINNQNANTQQQIESQMSCSTIDKNSVSIKDYYLLSNGSSQTATGWGITNYLKIDNKSVIKPLSNRTSVSPSLCFYDINKSLISCINDNSLVINNAITIPESSSYVRFSIDFLQNKPQFSICKNGNQALTDSLTDSNIDSDLGGGFFDDFNNEDFGFSDIVKIPLNTINQLTSTSCSPISIPIPFTNGSVSLPCMTQIYQDNIPTIYNIWKVVSFGIIAYFIVIDLFHIVKGFKDPESDKVEVLDL